MAKKKKEIMRGNPLELSGFAQWSKALVDDKVISIPGVADRMKYVLTGIVSGVNLSTALKACGVSRQEFAAWKRIKANNIILESVQARLDAQLESILFQGAFYNTALAASILNKKNPLRWNFEDEDQVLTAKEKISALPGETKMSELMNE